MVSSYDLKDDEQVVRVLVGIPTSHFKASTSALALAADARFLLMCASSGGVSALHGGDLTQLQPSSALAETHLGNEPALSHNDNANK